MTKPSRETIAKRIKAGWDPERARTLPPLKVGNKPKEGWRPYVYPKGGRWWGNVRGPGDKRVYLGIYPTRQDAEDAAARYILTGQKPPRSNARWAKPREPKAQQPKRTIRAAKPAPATITPARRNPDERIAMMKQIWRSMR